MGLTCLAPFLLGLLALGCPSWAAPLQSQEPVVISFPGDLVSRTTDVELANVSFCAEDPEEQPC